MNHYGFRWYIGVQTNISRHFVKQCKTQVTAHSSELGKIAHVSFYEHYGFIFVPSFLFCFYLIQRNPAHSYSARRNSRIELQNTTQFHIVVLITSRSTTIVILFYVSGWSVRQGYNVAPCDRRFLEASGVDIISCVIDDLAPRDSGMPDDLRTVCWPASWRHRGALASVRQAPKTMGSAPLVRTPCVD